MRDDSYTQCKLAKGNTTQTSFIPTQFAEFGKLIMLKNQKGEWETDWMIISVGQTVTKAHALEQERVFTRTRKASDI